MDEAGVALTQMHLRWLNERVLEAEHGAARMQFRCECGDPSCEEHVVLSGAGYEAVRARPTLFVPAPGHLVEAVDRLVATNERYMTVEAQGEAGMLAREF